MYFVLMLVAMHARAVVLWKCILACVNVKQNKAWCISALQCESPRHRLNIKTVFPRYGDFHVTDKTVVRQSDSPIFNMGIPILVRRYLCIETGPWLCLLFYDTNCSKCQNVSTGDVSLAVHIKIGTWLNFISVGSYLVDIGRRHWICNRFSTISPSAYPFREVRQQLIQYNTCNGSCDCKISIGQ